MYTNLSFNMNTNAENAPLIPDVADNIEVLWILEDNSEFWWPATVLETSLPRRLGNINALGLIQYEPGHNIETYTDYKVTFFNGNFIYHWPSSKGRPFRQNTWRFKTFKGNNITENETDVISSPRQQNQIFNISSMSNVDRHSPQNPSSDIAHTVAAPISTDESPVTLLQNKLLELQTKVEMLQMLHHSSSQNDHKTLTYDRSLAVLGLKAH